MMLKTFDVVVYIAAQTLTFIFLQYIMTPNLCTFVVRMLTVCLPLGLGLLVGFIWMVVDIFVCLQICLEKNLVILSVIPICLYCRSKLILRPGYVLTCRQ